MATIPIARLASQNSCGVVDTIDAYEAWVDTGVGAGTAAGGCAAAEIVGVLPEAVVMTRVPPGVRGALITMTAVGRLLSAVMYRTENGSHAATRPATARLNTVRYTGGRLRVLVGLDVGGDWLVIAVMDRRIRSCDVAARAW
jgi:hypothetical protein